MKKHLYALVSAALLAAGGTVAGSTLTGCSVAVMPGATNPDSSSPNSSSAAGTRPAGAIAEGKAAIDVVTRFESAPLRVQAVVTPYTGSDVIHLVLKLFTVSGSTEAAVKGDGDKKLTQDVSKGGFNLPLRFDKLHKETKYRVRGYAYKATGTADADKISVDAGSFVDIAVTNDDRPTVATLSIELVGKIFNGQGTGSVEFKPGLVNDPGDEKVE